MYIYIPYVYLKGVNGVRASELATMSCCCGGGVGGVGRNSSVMAIFFFYFDIFFVCLSAWKQGVTISRMSESGAQAGRGGVGQGHRADQDLANL